MQIIVSDVDHIRGKKLYTDVQTLDVPNFTEDSIYYAMREVYGFSAEYMNEATIHVGERVAIITWYGIEFNMIREASLPHW